MTTIADVLHNAAGVAVPNVVVRASLVAASEVLLGGGAIVRETDTTTASDGTWSLVLTPISSLSIPGGAYYVIAADGHRWTIDVPASGTYTIDDVLIEPGPLPGTGATTAALILRPIIKLWNGSAYVTVDNAVFYIGGPTDPTQNDGDFWFQTN